MKTDIYEKMIGYTYKADAPDLLIVKIAEMQRTISIAKGKTKRNEKAIEFYEGVLATMKYAFNSLLGMEQMYKQLIFLQSENKFIKEHLKYCQNELNKYKTVEELQLSGDYEQVLKAVDEYLKNKLPNEQ